MNKKAAVSGLVVIIAVCVVVIYQTSFARVDDGYVSQRERSIIKKFDQDGDGRLDKQEQRTANEAIKTAGQREKDAWLKRMDTNGDGKVSKEEEAAAAALKQQYIKKFDKNSDGKLSTEEREAARKSAGR